MGSKADGGGAMSAAKEGTSAPASAVGVADDTNRAGQVALGTPVPLVAQGIPETPESQEKMPQSVVLPRSSRQPVHQGLKEKQCPSARGPGNPTAPIHPHHAFPITHEDRDCCPVSDPKG